MTGVLVWYVLVSLMPLGSQYHFLRAASTFIVSALVSQDFNSKYHFARFFEQRRRIAHLIMAEVPSDFTEKIESFMVQHQRIGEGSFSKFFLATHTTTGEKVIVVVLGHKSYCKLALVLFFVDTGPCSYIGRWLRK